MTKEKINDELHLSGNGRSGWWIKMDLFYKGLKTLLEPCCHGQTPVGGGFVHDQNSININCNCLICFTENTNTRNDMSIGVGQTLQKRRPCFQLHQLGNHSRGLNIRQGRPLIYRSSCREDRSRDAKTVIKHFWQSLFLLLSSALVEVGLRIEAKPFLVRLLLRLILAKAAFRFPLH